MKTEIYGSLCLGSGLFLMIGSVPGDVLGVGLWMTETVLIKKGKSERMRENANYENK
ncbi:hypothetical protein [Alkalibacterium thalassium]|uniref:Uncharacterized protein n=1 Tax=Alkalibacterium thalassium TaxID=426701 RepID=A0A1G9FL98_9LACT|nr:hypothetical protein [Alkalibacterium thalassium]SDK89160.1 hypothetical protein SAMN04488098_108112 [Alkalibacterium thalassium]